MKERSPRNRTLTVAENEQTSLKKRLFFHKKNEILPAEFADLLIIDPPYNLDKDFHGLNFSKTNDEAYLEYLKSWFPKIIKTLKPTGSVYICGDWKSAFCLYQIMRDFTIIRNRII
jgi:site-specific DNA-methyltransferase (adenine-specific)